MGRYMIVVLKDEFKTGAFIEELNADLTIKYGANAGVKVVTKKFVTNEAEYINKDPDGLKQLQHWERPVSAEALEQSFFWYRTGEFHLKISGGATAIEARDAVAICKWIVKTRGRYIDKTQSSNFEKKVIREYLDNILSEHGYDPEKLWQM